MIWVSALFHAPAGASLRRLRGLTQTGVQCVCGRHQYGMLCHSNVGTLSTAKGRRGCLASANRKLFTTVSLCRGTRQVQPLVPPISCRSSRC